MTRAQATTASRDAAPQTLERAASHYTAGDLVTAERLYLEVLARKPAEHRAVFMLGMIAYQRQAFASARPWLEQALVLNGSTSAYWLYLGRTLQALREHAAALVHFKRARQLEPSSLEAWLCEGKLYRDLGAAAQARAVYEAAATIHAKSAVLELHAGDLAMSLDQLDEARSHFEAATCLDPQLLAAVINLGVVHQRAGRLEQARTCHERACQLDPSSVVARSNLGWTLHRLDSFAAAEAELRRAFALDPNYGPAAINLAGVLHELGEIDEALRYYRHALERAPDAANYSSYLSLMLYDTHTPPSAVLAEARRWADCYAPAAPNATHDLTRLANAPRLRVGYVSPDFRLHSVMHFIAPLIAAHDPARFEIVCYSNSPRSDDVTAKLARHARFQAISARSDDQVAEQIRSDGIHILVDLAGHTTGNRLAVFSRAPAPVQATYVGHPGTTGVSSIGHRFTDALADPERVAEPEYSEHLVRLPGGFCCFSPLRAAPDVNALPRLARGFITFGSLNNYTKLSETVLSTWARLLAELSDSRLILQSRPFADPSICERVWGRFAALGITRDRVELRGPLPYEAHLALYNEIDLALDTFPWNGHTTTCLALHMGVPVVVLEGDRFGSRMGRSVLTRVGLEDWIARDLDRYVALALERARDIDGLSRLRGRLREQLTRSPLCDAARFTRELETVYEALWREYLAGAPQSKHA